MLPKTHKHSKQREALMRILKNTKSHPSAEWLHTELKKEFPNVSLATVYRNLNLLLLENQIIRLDVGSGTEHYDACCDTHYHLACKGCGAIIDITLPPFSELNRQTEELNNVLIEEHSLIFYGMCQKCKIAL